MITTNRRTILVRLRGYIMKRVAIFLFTILIIALSLTSCTTTNHVCIVEQWINIQTATCEQVGIEMGTCQICNKSETRILPKLQHDIVNGRCSNCKKVVNAYSFLAYYIKTNGEYSEGGEYCLYLDDTTIDGTTYAYAAWYNVYRNELIFGMTAGDYFMDITLTPNATAYFYYISRNKQSYMIGELNPSTFQESQLYLSYTHTNITNETSILSFQKLAASMANLLLIAINSNLNPINIKVSDLGFIHY